MARVPKYRKHPNGQAFVQHRSINRPQNREYLGKHGSEESIRRYRAFLKRLEAKEKTSAPVVSSLPSDCIASLVAAYLRHCETYYRDGDGKRTKEFSCMVEALRRIVALYGDEPATEFDVSRFEDYRNALIVEGMARTTINSHAGRVRRMFRWAATKQYVSPMIWHSLATVEGLKVGRTSAREPQPVRAVTWEAASEVLPHLSPVVAAMVEVQFWCGMRPQDVCRIRQCDLDTTGEVWLYRPERHKGSWRGHSLIKAIPARVQPVLRAWFRNEPEAYLFSPRDAVAWHAKRKAEEAVKARTTKEYPCEQRAKERRKAARVANGPRHRACYTTDTYRQAVEYGLAKLNGDRAEKKPPLPPVETWTPNQLRHGIGTLVERKLGRQAAQRYLGHRHLGTTELYIEKDAEEILAIAKLVDEI